MKCCSYGVCFYHLNELKLLLVTLANIIIFRFNHDTFNHTVSSESSENVFFLHFSLMLFCRLNKMLDSVD